MKHLFLSIALGVIFYSSSCPQSAGSNHGTLDYSRLKQEMSLPSRSQSSGIEKSIDILREWNNRKLNKDEENSETNIAAFRPVKITADSLYRQTFKYDEKGNTTGFLKENWENGQWVNASREITTYNSFGQTLTRYYDEWKNGAWTFVLKWIHTYDDNGNELSRLYEYWDAGVLTRSNRYSYSTNGNETVCIIEYMSKGQWLNLSRDTYKLDATGNTLEDVKQMWVNGAWENWNKWTAEYNTFGKIVNITYSDWNSGAWVFNRKYTYTFDSNGNQLTRNGITTHTYDTRGNELTYIDDNRRHTYTYDSNDFRVTDIYEENYNNAWKKFSRLTFTNDQYGNPVKIEALEWKDTTWQRGSVASPILFRFNNGKENWGLPAAHVIEIEYNSFTGVETAATAIKQFSLSQNYPNPFNPSTTINYSVKEPANVKLTIFDALGKKVAVIVDEYKPAGTYNIKFDARNLPSGVYLYRLESGSQTTSKKFILMK